MFYANVIVKQRTRVSELTYALNAQIVPYVKVGSLALVPLRRKLVKGVVVGFRRSVDKKIKDSVREIIKLDQNDQPFSPLQIKVIHCLAEHYAAPLAEVAFHALDLEQLWSKTARVSFIKPLIVTGSWLQRRRAYERIIQKTSGLVLLIFAQNSYATDFQKFLQQSEQEYRIYAIKDFNSKKRTSELVEALKITDQAILIGTLSEVFIPLQSGDTIIIDQPYHIGAKSQSRPFMTARQIALTRGDVEGLRVVLGDDLISPKDLLAVKDKIFRLVSAKSTRQPISLIDRRGQKEVIAPSLMEEIEVSIKANEKILVLVLARGWASALVCQDCGYLSRCPNCKRTIGLSGQNLRCRYCATEVTLPKLCPSCQSEKLRPVGEGVVAIKKYLSSKFEKISIQELSSDQPVLNQFAQITVATEKIFSYPDFHFAKTFIISVDRLLAGTNLDGAWRLLGYLIELQSRSKQIFVQTYFPDSIVWSAAAAGNVRPFFAKELADRQRLRLPPYGAIITVRGTAGTTEKLSDEAERITEEILKILPRADISYPEVDDRRGAKYLGSLTIFLPKPPQNSLKNKLASLLPPSWHLDID